MYVRVSSKEQNESGFSPEAQRVGMYGFARSNDFDVTDREFEDAETAKNSGRKEFMRMIEYVKANNIKHILVEKTDRLYRNFKDYVLIDELIENYGVTVWLVKENTSIGKNSRASDKMMHGIKTVMAKGFIDNLREEVQKGFEIKISHGEYPRQAPLGYINAKDPYNPKHNIIVPDPHNRNLIVKIFEYYASGIYSMKSLIVTLEKEGLTANIPVGRKRLCISTIARIISNPFYIGRFLWKGKIIQGSHEPILSAELWQKAQEVVCGRNTNKSKEHNVMPFAYKGMFACGVCGRSITAEKAKGKYNYYHCTQYKTNCGQPWVKEKTIDDEFAKKTELLKISETGVDFVTAALKQSLEEKRAWEDTAHNALVSEHMRLRKRMDTMYEDKLDKKISEADYERRVTEYSSQLQDMEKKINKYNKANISYYEFGRKILELAQNAEMLLENASPEEKREFTQFLLSNSTITDGTPNFSLKLPYSAIEKRSPCDDRVSWQGRWESDPRQRFWRPPSYH